ncbi:hypothetical protein [Aquisphaera insulae]|uniref:hypothetical protein n=1 Tax=Aquisphaera insulae TaxID=2712864 RepID=UPI0013ED2EC5|nr:hypothetical protein [Aquisphaera insulae]
MAVRLLTANDLAERWRASAEWVDRLIREEGVPYVWMRFGPACFPTMRFRLASIEEWELTQPSGHPCHRTLESDKAAKARAEARKVRTHLGEYRA